MRILTLCQIHSYKQNEKHPCFKPKVLLNLETTPDIKVAGTFKDYYNLLNKRLEYLCKLIQDLQSKN